MKPEQTSLGLFSAVTASSTARQSFLLGVTAMTSSPYEKTKGHPHDSDGGVPPPPSQCHPLCPRQTFMTSPSSEPRNPRFVPGEGAAAAFNALRYEFLYPNAKGRQPEATHVESRIWQCQSLGWSLCIHEQQPPKQQPGRQSKSRKVSGRSTTLVKYACDLELPPSLTTLFVVFVLSLDYLDYMKCSSCITSIS